MKICARDSFEKYILQTQPKETAIKIIVARRKYNRENAEYTNSLIKEQYIGRYSCKNEKTSCTLNILEDDYED